MNLRQAITLASKVPECIREDLREMPCCANPRIEEHARVLDELTPFHFRVSPGNMRVLTLDESGNIIRAYNYKRRQ